MYTLITIFYVSLIAMALMIFLKRREVMKGKESVVARVGAGVDPVFQGVFTKAKDAASYVNKHTFIGLAHWLAYHILYNIRKVYVAVKARFIAMPQGKKLIDAVRGRGEVKDHGASFYLRRISADHPVK